MNVSGPSRLRGPRPVPNSRERDNDEDLTRMVAELGLSDVERLQSLYDHRERRGKGPSDREVAFILLMQNARELAEFNADLALAQRLAVDGDEEPDPTPRPTPAVALQRDIEKSKMQTWSQLLDSFLLTPVSSGQTTPTPGQAPTITARCPPR
ncbi:hypothetical protein C8R48DRAFT_777204 [Suillus tomentosus]|nr:hypothetical protein C8R48DRAFT_777204 [Suillus tomentosus]